MSGMHQIFLDQNSKVAEKVFAWPQVLEDDRGPYGYGFKNSPELMALDHVIGEVPLPVVLRDTEREGQSSRHAPSLCAYKEFEMPDAASAEGYTLAFFIRFIAHVNGMSMARLESGPSPEDPEHVQDRVANHIAGFAQLAVDALELVSAQAYSECIDNDLWHRIREYPLGWRFKILRLANSHERLRQLLGTFPLLALKMVMEPMRTGLSDAHVNNARALTLSGKPLKEVAKALNASLALRKLEPEAAESVAGISTKLYELDDTIRHLAHFYENDLLNWLDALQKALNVSSEYAEWVGREYRYFTGDANAKKRNVDYIGDWVRGCRDHEDQLREANLRVFNPRMGYQSAINASQAWHDHLTAVQQIQGLFNPFGFEETFKPLEINFDRHAASWPSDASIGSTEIKRVSSYQELHEVARSFRNCATIYVHEIQHGQCSLYTFRDADQFLALLELRKNFGRYEIGQFLGPFNRQPVNAGVKTHHWPE